MPLNSDFTKSYNSFSGVDIKAVLGGVPIATMQGISVSVAREKAPIFTMGSADSRAFGRGKRTIAGSMVFIQFDEEPYLQALKNLRFLSDKDDLRPEFTDQVSGTTVSSVGSSSNAPGVPIQLQEQGISTPGSDQQAAKPWYPDQVPPIDVVLAAANEMGQLAIMKVLGVEILNSGWGISVDDIVSEHSYTFVATGIVPWQSLGMHEDMLSK